MPRTLLNASLALLVITLPGACSSPAPTLPAVEDGPPAPAVSRDSLAAAPAPDTVSVPAWGGYIGSGGE